MHNFWQELKKPIIAIAPMAGITDSAFRFLCKEFGADVVYTEMTSIDALYYNSKKTLAMLEFQKKEKPIVLQLFGKRPELVAKAVEIATEAGFDGIDLNFGCPAPKVVRHEGGVMLLKKLNLCRELVQAVCEATKLPVSIKTRVSIGSGKEKKTALDFIEKIKDLPVAGLMLHGRTFEQGFSGDIDFDAIKSVKKKFKGIVIANGGINTPEDAKKMIDLTGADGVGLARGLYGRPWLARQVDDFLEKGKYVSPTLSQIKKTALRHAELNYKTKGDYGIVELRKHLCWYFRGFLESRK
ncbi:tRNA-dihydrouridine synthase [Candidatus Falkowbacteria bacterium]|nr:tRNA-dihydrouridine synthase [Candidatus Falkowbacteria bacterium]